MRLIPALALLTLCTLPLSTHAETELLKWDKTTVAVSTSLFAKSVEAEFSFSNTSGKDVRITDIQTSCGCTTAQIKQDAWAPGETGSFRTLFEIGQRTGGQRKQLKVTAETDSRREEYTLHLITTIPEPVQLPRRLLLWRAGQGTETQKLKLTAVEGVDLNLIKDNRTKTRP